MKWQAEVISFRQTNRQEELEGLVWKKELAPKLRSDVSHFAFSSDGNRQTRFVIRGAAAFLRFNFEGSKLFVLSETQSVYAFDMKKLSVKSAAK